MDHGFVIAFMTKVRLNSPSFVGEKLLTALENGVSKYPQHEGRFLQVSGIIFGFNPDRPPGKRINPEHVRIQGKRLILKKVKTTNCQLHCQIV